jgi:hypothetical protein
MKRTRIALLALLGLICLPVNSHADVELKIIPQCLKYEITGVPICGYKNIEDVRSLYTLDAELELRRDVERLEKDKITELESQVANLRAAHESILRAGDMLKARNVELTEQLIETDRKFQKERVKPRWGNPLAWTLSAVLAAGLAGFIGHELLD